MLDRRGMMLDQYALETVDPSVLQEVGGGGSQPRKAVRGIQFVIFFLTFNTFFNYFNPVHPQLDTRSLLFIGSTQSVHVELVIMHSNLASRLCV